MQRRKPHRWTDEETSFLIENYGTINSQEIAEKLNLNQSQIITKARYLNLKSTLKKRLDNYNRVIQSGNLPLEEFKTMKDHIKFKCKYCGGEFISQPTKIVTGHTKSCGCTAVGLRKGTENISGTFFSKTRQGARTRNLVFELDLNFLEELLKKQNFKCALTGQKLVFGYIDIRKYTASLDRIDSSKGYTKDNVQFVHKDVNMCKQNLTQQQFIEMCRMVNDNFPIDPD